MLLSTGGIVSLFDVYLYYNKLRGTDKLSPDEILLACKEF